MNQHGSNNADKDTRDLSWPCEDGPRWLYFSGLPQLMKPWSSWAAWRAIVMFDHQTMALRHYRRGPKKQGFALPHSSLTAATGLSASGVRAALTRLAHTNLLAYKPGLGRDRKGGRWSEFYVDRQVVRAIYKLVAPAISTLHGGVEGAKLIDLPKDGMLIYGRRRIEEIIVSYEELAGLANESRMDYEVDRDHLVSICGLQG